MIPPIRDHTSVGPDVYDRLRRGHHEDRRLELLEGRLRQVPGVRRVLEIGAGTGSLLVRLAELEPHLELHALEPDARLAAYASNRQMAGRISVHQIAVEDFSDSAPFDLVYSVDVLHHLDDPEAAFEQVRAALRTGGHWIVMEPNLWHPYVFVSQERMRRAGVGEDHFRPGTMLPLLEAAGFRLEERSYFLLLPASVRVPQALHKLERLLERIPPLGGSLVLDLVAI